MGEGEGGEEDGLICRWHRRLATEGELRYRVFGGLDGLFFWPAVPSATNAVMSAAASDFVAQVPNVW
jgi:hypothetical protein